MKSLCEIASNDCTTLLLQGLGTTSNLHSLLKFNNNADYRILLLSMRKFNR